MKTTPPSCTATSKLKLEASEGVEGLVLKTAPCSFLDLQNNECTIYDVRPKACSEYPHTDRRKFIQIANLTIENTAICPATFNIVEALKKRVPFDLSKK